ncbi:hypothetical protein [Nocardia abscessus]|uniref:hypothetical protein n=1 Tax=Nocardia abscessus TaxID=120957 RepID=UPI002455F21F|nr:hypothetical protein [Nocardia abscessus]
MSDMASPTKIMIRGEHVEITADQVFLATRDQTPDKPHTYGVLVNGVLWPPLQLIALATGVPGNSGDTRNYNSHTALKALNELGFATFEEVTYSSNGNVVVRENRKRG